MVLSSSSKPSGAIGLELGQGEGVADAAHHVLALGVLR